MLFTAHVDVAAALYQDEQGETGKDDETENELPHDGSSLKGAREAL